MSDNKFFSFSYSLCFQRYLVHGEKSFIQGGVAGIVILKCLRCSVFRNRIEYRRYWRGWTVRAAWKRAEFLEEGRKRGSISWGLRRKEIKNRPAKQPTCTK